jgi:hypothetical protein
LDLFLFSGFLDMLDLDLIAAGHHLRDVGEADTGQFVDNSRLGYSAAILQIREQFPPQYEVFLGPWGATSWGETPCRDGWGWLCQLWYWLARRLRLRRVRFSSESSVLRSAPVSKQQRDQNGAKFRNLKSGASMALYAKTGRPLKLWFSEAWCRRTRELAA